MEGARIITLEGPDNGEVTSVTFEEAFGEHSELRGRGRARRQARKMDRISKRRERKSARQEMRLAKKKRRVEARVERRAMKGQGQRDEALADAESQQTIEAMQPQDEEVNYDQPQEESSEESYEEAPQELDQQSEYSEEESEFEAGSSADDVSSFDAEMSGVSNANGDHKTKEQKIAWHQKAIDLYGGQLNKLKERMSIGKLPSNEIARSAKIARGLSERIQRSKERLAQLQREPSSGASGRTRRPSPATRVQRNLNAEISDQRIEVPAADEFSGFDAKAMIKENKNVLIGVGVATAAIISLHLMGVFKK